MKTIRKTIVVTAQQASWIKDQTNKAEVEAIRAALIETEQSGTSEPFDCEQFKSSMIANHRTRHG